MGVGNFFGIELLLKILQKGAQVFFVHAFERHVGMVEEILVLMLRWFAVTDDGDVLGRVFGDQRCNGTAVIKLHFSFVNTGDFGPRGQVFLGRLPEHLGSVGENGTAAILMLGAFTQ